MPKRKRIRKSHKIVRDPEQDEKLEEFAEWLDARPIDDETKSRVMKTVTKNADRYTTAKRVHGTNVVRLTIDPDRLIGYGTALCLEESETE